MSVPCWKDGRVSVSKRNIRIDTGNLVCSILNSVRSSNEAQKKWALSRARVISIIQLGDVIYAKHFEI